MAESKMLVLIWLFTFFSLVLGARCNTIPGTESCGTWCHRFGSRTNWHGQISVPRTKTSRLRYRCGNYKVSTNSRSKQRSPALFRNVSRRMSFDQFFPLCFREFYRVLLTGFHSTPFVVCWCFFLCVLVLPNFNLVSIKMSRQFSSLM